MPKLRPLDKAIILPLGETGVELHVLEWDRTADGLTGAVDALNGTAFASGVVQFKKLDSRARFIEEMRRGYDKLPADLDLNKSLIDLGRAVDEHLRQQQVDEEDAEAQRITTAQRLIQFAAGEDVTLFHSDRDDAYARFAVDGVVQTFPIRSADFRRWLARRYHVETGRPPNGQAISDALLVIEGKARFEGQKVPLAVRVARDEDGAIWVDMCDARWRAIRVTAEGWEIVEKPPILFRRYKSAAPLVEPVRGGTVEDLSHFLNLRDARLWMLVRAWLVAALVPDIPHPILIGYGEQGSAKSTQMQLLSQLVHPSLTPLRSEPRDKAEWIQAADHTWLLTLDNVSRVSPWLSDALCRAVTGEGDSKRVLYTVDDDHLFAFRRVLALTGIDANSQAPDVLSRAITVEMAPIEDEKRQGEAELLAAFRDALPGLFGGLLDLLVGVLRVLPTVQPERLPRMADFARIGCAVGRVVGDDNDVFLATYFANIRGQNVESIGAVSIGDPLVSFLHEKPEGKWEGTATDLLSDLSKHLEHHGQPQPRDWPRTAQAVSGSLRRLEPSLRALGILIERPKRSGTSRRLSIFKKSAENTSHTSHTSSEDPSERETAPDGVTSFPADDEIVTPEEKHVTPIHAQNDVHDVCDEVPGASFVGDPFSDGEEYESWRP